MNLYKKTDFNSDENRIVLETDETVTIPKIIVRNITELESDSLMYVSIQFLKRNANDIEEYFVLEDDYNKLKSIIKDNNSHYIKELDGWVFFTIRDFMLELALAKENKLF